MGGVPLQPGNLNLGDAGAPVARPHRHVPFVYQNVRSSVGSTFIDE